MADLVCVAFDDPTTADRALTELTALQKEYVIELKDACVVVRSPDGEVHLHQAMPLVKTGALAGGSSGALWGTLIGLLFLNPLAGMALGAGRRGERRARRQAQRLRHPRQFHQGARRHHQAELVRPVPAGAEGHRRQGPAQDGGVQRPRAQDVALGRAGKASARGAGRYGGDRARPETAGRTDHAATGCAATRKTEDELPRGQRRRAFVRVNRGGGRSERRRGLPALPGERLFGICVVGTSGNVYAVGDAEHEFSIMSVSKPFVFALVCEAIGHEEVRGGSGSTPPGCRSTRWRRSSRAATAGPTRW